MSGWVIGTIIIMLVVILGGPRVCRLYDEWSFNRYIDKRIKKWRESQ